MKAQDVIRKDRSKYRKTIVMSIRITKAQSDFLKEKNFSPNAIMQTGLHELGFKEE
jgi:hypothetical protein